MSRKNLGARGSQTRCRDLRTVEVELPLVHASGQPIGSVDVHGTLLSSHELAVEGLPRLNPDEHETRVG